MKLGVGEFLEPFLQIPIQLPLHHLHGNKQLTLRQVLSLHLLAFPKQITQINGIVGNEILILLNNVVLFRFGSGHQLFGRILQHRMDDLAHHTLLHIFINSAGHLNLCHLTQIKLQRTVDVGGQGADRVGHIFQSVNVRLGLGDGNDIALWGELRRHRNLPAFHLNNIRKLLMLNLILQLSYKAALFVGRVRGVGIINQVDSGSTLQQAEEVVGIRRVVMLVGGQPEILFHPKKQHGVGGLARRNTPLIHRKHDDRIEVQHSGFQHSHHLKTFVRIAHEGQSQRTHLLVDKGGEGVEVQEEILETGGQFIHFFQLLHQQFQHFSIHILFLAIQLLNYILEENNDLIQKVASLFRQVGEVEFQHLFKMDRGKEGLIDSNHLIHCVLRCPLTREKSLCQHRIADKGGNILMVIARGSAGIQVVEAAIVLCSDHQVMKEMEGGSMLYRIAHGDVALFLSVGMHKRHQQRLVGEDYGGALELFRRHLLQNLHGSIHLSHGLRGRRDGDVLGDFPIIVAYTFNLLDLRSSSHLLHHLMDAEMFIIIIKMV